MAGSIVGTLQLCCVALSRLASVPRVRAAASGIGRQAVVVCLCGQAFHCPRWQTDTSVGCWRHPTPLTTGFKQAGLAFPCCSIFLVGNLIEHDADDVLAQGR